MSNTLGIHTIILALGLGLVMPATSILAQEAAPTESIPAADAPSTEAKPDDGLSMGTPTGPKTKETAAINETYLAASFEKWEQLCIKTENDENPCQLYQLLLDAEGTSVAEISIFPLPEGGQAVAGANVIVPLDTLLTANLTIAIDSNQPKVYPFSVCVKQGCIARIGLTAEEIAQFKKGAKATMTIVPAIAPDQKEVLDISLAGFTSGYDAVVASIPKPAN